MSDYDTAIRNWLANSAAARGSLPRETVDMLDQGLCPDCGHSGFVLGPRGGLEINIECGNGQCRARFNVARGITDHHLVWATRLAKEEDGGPCWQRPAST